MYDVGTVGDALCAESAEGCAVRCGR